MKKIFLFLVSAAFAVNISSCSSDKEDHNNHSQGTIFFKANGVQQNCYNVHVAKTIIHTGDLVETELDVHGYMVVDELHLHLKKDTLEDTASFLYEVNGMEYTRGENFAVVFTSNGSNQKLQGTFSGDLIGPEDTITITDGSFDIQY